MSAFLSTLPAPNSVSTKEGAIALFEGYLLSGYSPDLFNVAECLNPGLFAPLRSRLFGMWNDWVWEGGEDDRGQTERGLGNRFLRELLDNA